MTASKAFAASVLALAIAIPLSALASPALASSTDNSSNAVSVPADSQAVSVPADESSVSIPSIFDKKEKEGEEGTSEKRDEAEHGENHHQIPPVVIRPKYGEDYEDGEDGEYAEDSEDGEGYEDGEDGDDDEGGFVVPGPNPSARPNSSSSPGASSAPGNMSDDAINQDQPNSYAVSPIGTSTDPASEKTVEDGDADLNPEAAPAVNLANVRTSVKTPADVFMESATLALAALGIGAVAMGGVASTRAIRLRRNPKGDYFYEGDK